MTADAFIRDYTADGVEHFYFAQATAVIGDRIWIFFLEGPERSLIVPFLTTVKITASAAVD
jgi:hypothetical protein